MTASLTRSSQRADSGRALVAGALAVAVFAASWIGLHHSFYTRDQIVDTPVYEKYGDWVADGQLPYRDFRPEYPPLALPVFILPSLLAGENAELGRYSGIFETLMLFCGAAAVALMAFVLRASSAGAGRTAAALGFAALAPLALGSVVLSRFDLWPAALTVGALAALAAGRHRLGLGVLALAVSAKLYPAVLLPLALPFVWRRRGRREAVLCGALFAGVLLAVYLPFLLVAPDGVAASMERQLSRPLQIESLGAALLLVLGRPLGLDLEMVGSHGSQNIAGDAGVVVGVVQTVVQAAVLVGIAVAFARGEASRDRLLRYSAAAVLAFVALGKVLSPQFLIWLVPLVPLVRGRRGLAASALLGLALVLTQLWFPFRYWDYALTFDGTVAWLVLVRDVLLVAALAVLLSPWPQRTAIGRDSGV